MRTVGTKRVIVVFEVVVLVAVLVIGACMATEEDIGEHVSSAQETAKESSETWSGWAKDKISEGLGFKGSESDPPVVEPTAKDAAATDKITDAATGAGEYASNIKEGAAERAGEAKVKASEAAEEAKRKTKEAYERAEESVREAKDKAAEEAEEKKKQAEEHVGWGKEKAKQGYEAAKGRAEETYQAARDTIASTFETANEEKPSTRTSDEEL